MAPSADNHRARTDMAPARPLHNPLYFICPDHGYCQRLAEKLRAHGIPAEALGGVRAVEEHEHHLLEELVPGPGTRRGIVHGVLLGGLAGLVGGLLIHRYPPAGVDVSPTAVVVTVIVAAILAAMITGLVNRDLPHSLEPLGPEDTAGTAILMVSGSERHRREAYRYVRRHHPNVRIARTRDA